MTTTTSGHDHRDLAAATPKWLESLNERTMTASFWSLEDEEDLKAFGVAALVLLGEYADPTHGGTHYFNASLVNPDWASSMEVIVDIGNHRFLKRRAA